MKLVHVKPELFVIDYDNKSKHYIPFEDLFYSELEWELDCNYPIWYAIEKSMQDKVAKITSLIIGKADGEFESIDE